MTLTLEGDANDYIGKGLSCGCIIVFPPKSSRFVAEDNVLIGNVVLYWRYRRTGLFPRPGPASDSPVRNSGVLTVVEGAGDHCCEYMTGGVVLVIGTTGQKLRRRHERRPGVRPRPCPRLPQPL